MSKPIIENLALIKGWELRSDYFSPPCIHSAVYETDEVIRPYEAAPQSKYCLEAKIGIEFYANNVQLPRAIDIATRTLSKRLYGDIQGMVHEIMLQISNGDRDAAMQTCGRILDYTSAVR